MKIGKIYIAASYPRKAEAAKLRLFLREHGYVITSGWIDTHPTDDPAINAVADVAHVKDADAVVAITGDTLTSGGRHAEVGMGVITGKLVILLGPRERMIFHHHPDVLTAENTLQLLDLLRTHSHA